MQCRLYLKEPPWIGLFRCGQRLRFGNDSSGSCRISDLLFYLLAYAALLSFGLIVLRLFVRRDYLKRGRLSAVVATLQALLWFVYGGFPTMYLADDWPAVHVSPPVHVAGLALIVVGLSFLLVGIARLGLPRSLGCGGKQLEQTGLYRRTRNPQALACGLYVLGFSILWPSWYAAGWAILFVVLIHVMIITEEEHLRRVHGEPYRHYQQEVPRYFHLDSIDI